jgi:hypothetical protein
LPRIFKSIYQEWWYFDFLDEVNDIQFTATCSLNNPGGIPGGLPKGCDVITMSIHGNETFVTPKGDMMESFSVTPRKIDLGGKFTISIVDDHHVSFVGSDGGAGVSFDLVFSHRFPGLTPRKVPVGDRWFDIMKYYPVMPSAVVDGTFTIKGKVFRVKGAAGYHDHFLGAPTRVGWAPWVFINTPEFEILAVIVPSRRDFLLACIDGKTWINCGRPTHRVSKFGIEMAYDFKYPVEFLVDSSRRGWKVHFTTWETGTHASMDIGIDDYKCPLVWGWNFKATGAIYHDGESVKSFSGVPAAVYYMTKFDLIEFDKQTKTSERKA